MHKAWSLLCTMSAQLPSQVSTADASRALNLGARAFLEQSYQQYVRSELQQKRNQVLCTNLSASVRACCSSCKAVLVKLLLESRSLKNFVM